MKRPFKKTINCDILQLFTIRNEQKTGTRHSSGVLGQKRASRNSNMRAERWTREGEGVADSSLADFLLHWGAWSQAKKIRCRQF